MTESGSSRSRPKGTYDVFLSFRGKDTRKNFTDHLYTALVQAGIHTFRDDSELPRGEEIPKHLLKAIPESKILIVVFSKGYASSRWCLNELVEIIECKNRNTDQIVLPIFYDIDPSDFQTQKCNFAKAFDKHDDRFKEKAKEWRKALEEAKNLSGWNLNVMANGYAFSFYSSLVSINMKSFIINPRLVNLDPKYLDVAPHLVGNHSIVRDISNFLSTTTDDVLMIGLHGMAGIGKTTIAKVVFNQLCYGFEGSCFLSNVTETSEQPNGLVLLQEQLLGDILKTNIWNINNVDRGMNVIQERLCHRRVLVVLDDVDQLKHLNILMRERCWYGPGSRIIITTRNERLLLKVDKKYEVKQLKRDESIQLFSWQAFRDKHLVEDYAELANDVVDYSGGLPLALEVLGSCLFEKNKARWKCVIEKLRKIPNCDIQEKLRISFDTLDDDKLQTTFLDIACFFIVRRKEFVAKVLQARCGFNPEDDLKTLIERSLLTINDWGEINMHDLLRDMGREIIRKISPDNPGKRNRIWHHEDAWNILFKQMGTKAIEGLALDVTTSKVEPLSTESFTKMKRLQLLKINGLHLIGCFKPFPKGLIWLCWHGCPLKSLPSDFELGNLVILDMQYSNIKELWKETKILNKLKILNLSYCKDLAKMPNFLGLSNLERLILKNCTSLVEVPQSIGHLKMLVLLNLEGCCRLKILSESICDVKSLETLNISGCSQLEKLPEHMGDMESLTELLADGIENKKFLSSIVHFKYVRKLSLCGYSFNQDSPSSTSWVSQISSWLSPLDFKGKASLPTSLAGWSLLRELKLASFGLSESATNCVDFGSLFSLEELDLSGNKFLNLPSGIGHLPRLQGLNVCNCLNLLLIAGLPSSLVWLAAYGCKSMDRIRLPIQSKRSPSFSIDGCRNLMEIEGMERMDDGLTVFSRDCYRLSESYKRSLAEVWSNNDYGYEICFSISDVIPNWFSYRGEKSSSLSFHLPPFFQGLAIWIVSYDVGNVFIKNKSNGIQLFKSRIGATFGTSSWVRYERKYEMAIEEYCGEELELYLQLQMDELEIKEIGVHVIVEKPDSFEESEWEWECNNDIVNQRISSSVDVEEEDEIDSQESEWEWDHDIEKLQGTTSSGDVEERDEIDSQSGTDRVILKLYHRRLHHPLLGSIASSTREQWITYLLKMLPAEFVSFVIYLNRPLT